MKRICILMVTLGLAAIFVFPAVARAQFLVVDCSGANPYAYPTISSALPNDSNGVFHAFTLIAGNFSTMDFPGAFLTRPFG